MTDLMIILGCPASGQTTLARRLAAELTVPILSKDDIKEALFDVLGGSDRDRSRRGFGIRDTWTRPGWRKK